MKTINKKAYTELIKEDLAFLNKHCPACPELDHVKLIVCTSIDRLYPDKPTDHAADIDHYRRELAESKERERSANQIIADKRKEIEAVEQRAVEAFKVACPHRDDGRERCWAKDPEEEQSCNAGCTLLRVFTEKLNQTK